MALGFGFDKPQPKTQFGKFTVCHVWFMPLAVQHGMGKFGQSRVVELKDQV